MLPKISVITVVYNNVSEIEETILSVINQDYINKEYIIIDGGSTDGTVEIIKKYESYINYWVSEPDNGIYFAMNKGIEIATGEWINFMNSGDYFVCKETLSNVFAKFSFTKYGVIYGNTVIKRNGLLLKIKADSIDKISIKMPLSHQSLFVKRFLIKSNKFNTFYKYAADYEMIFKLYKKGVNFNQISEYIAIYNQESGTTVTNFRRSIKERYTIQNNLAFKGRVSMFREMAIMSISYFFNKIVPLSIRKKRSLIKFKKIIY